MVKQITDGIKPKFLKSYEIGSLTQLYPLIKYVSDKKYDNKFWKYQDTKLVSNDSFDRFEFHKNQVYESYTEAY